MVMSSYETFNPFHEIPTEHTIECMKMTESSFNSLFRIPAAIESLAVHGDFKVFQSSFLDS